jgi:hypothetical protein
MDFSKNKNKNKNKNICVVNHKGILFNLIFLKTSLSTQI